MIKNGAAAGEAQCVEELQEDRQEEYRQLADGAPRQWRPVKHVTGRNMIRSQ